MTKSIAVIRGDGIGPEVIEAALDVLDHVDADLELIHVDAGLACRKETGEYLPEVTLEVVRDADAVLFGAITSPLASEDPHYKSVILGLRNELDAYANVRPARDLGQPCLIPGLDLVLVRENSEGLYNAPETEDADGVTTHRRITRNGSERVIRFAFEWAKRHERKQLHCFHKANVLRKSDGLFLSTYRDVSRAYGPGLVAKEMLLDNGAMQLVLKPQQFDTIVTMNLYGDVISDEMAGLVGGLGFAPSGSFGPRGALFEPVHGSAPDIAGKGVANPCGAILSAAMMLEHLGFANGSRQVEDAVRAALREGRTPDAGGRLSTEAFTAHVVASLK
ncbi:MAG TPA: isocitrate/isopropylmalate dehydrogenase family protein [Candidatus Thermoplasmatota archaeon]|nr:isocitrate/isopropylmalate dehydrogenase family protein [Candidatus Thermoplasmatota archaeon]